MGTVRSKDGTTIAFDVWGDGQPLIVVDGATAYRGVNLTNAEVGQLLREEFRVYAYDRRGAGPRRRSGRSPDQPAGVVRTTVRRRRQPPAPAGRLRAAARRRRCRWPA